MRLQPVPAFEDNLIWLLRDAAGGAVIVDPGESAPVLEALAGGPPPHAILLTHHHHDHISGVADLLHHWPGVAVIAPHDDRITHVTRRVGEGDQVEVGSWRFRVIGIPGHTTSHIAFHGHDSDGAGLLFCGDTLFSLGCGRMFEGTPTQMHASLQRLAALPGDTLVCCGHEYTLANAAFARTVDPVNAALRERSIEVRRLRDAGLPSLPSTIASERACNPFLRCHDPAVRASVERLAGHALQTKVEVFATLRRWKDGFRG